MSSASATSRAMASAASDAGSESAQRPTTDRSSPSVFRACPSTWRAPTSRAIDDRPLAQLERLRSSDRAASGSGRSPDRTRASSGVGGSVGMIAIARSCASRAASVSVLTHRARPSRSSAPPRRIGSASGPSVATASAGGRRRAARRPTARPPRRPGRGARPGRSRPASRGRRPSSTTRAPARRAGGRRRRRTRGPPPRPPGPMPRRRAARRGQPTSGTRARPSDRPAIAPLPGTASRPAPRRTRGGVAVARPAGGRRRRPPGAARGGTRSRRRRPPGPVTSTWLPTASRRPSSRSSSARPGDVREDVVVDPPAGDRRDADHRLGAFGQRDDPREAGPRAGSAAGGHPRRPGPHRAAPRRRTGCRPSAGGSAPTSSADGGASRMAASRACVAAASSRPRSTRSTRPLRSSSASHGRSGCRRCSSSERKVMIRTTRSWRSWRMRYEIDSRVAGSAQCRSSTTNTTGSISASRWKTPRIASNRRGWSVSVCGLCVGPARPAEHRHEAGEIGAGRHRRPRRGSRVRASGRASGAPRRSGRTGRRRDRRRRSHRRRRASLARSRATTSRRPGATCRRRPRPRRAGGPACPTIALSSARPIAASSVARPTSVGLTRRRGIAR